MNNNRVVLSGKIFIWKKNMDLQEKRNANGAAIAITKYIY